MVISLIIGTFMFVALIVICGLVEVIVHDLWRTGVFVSMFDKIVFGAAFLLVINIQILSIGAIVAMWINVLYQ